MKQITKTTEIINALQSAVGNDVVIDDLAVFEAIALNTLPLRKNHPLYNGSRFDRATLLEMAAALSLETRPVQIQHDTEPLPIGRVFYGQVLDHAGSSELRVLFFIDKSEEDSIRKIDNGTVDQVSVSVLPKHIYNSVSGFDYMGEESTFENIFSGTDPDGNTIGKNGVYGKLVGLDKWFEMSLVGMGGAQNARIVSRDQSSFGSSYEKLAASGLDPNVYVLQANTEIKKMDLTELVTQLTDTKVALAAAKAAAEALEAKLAEQTTKVAELEASLETATAEAGEPSEQLAAKDAEIASLTETNTAVAAEKDLAVASLKLVAQKLLTASGKVTAEVPEDVAALTALITETETALAATLVAGGRSQSATGDGTQSSHPVINVGAFRTKRK